MIDTRLVNIVTLKHPRCERRNYECNEFNHSSPKTLNDLKSSISFEEEVRSNGILINR